MSPEPEWPSPEPPAAGGIAAAAADATEAGLPCELEDFDSLFTGDPAEIELNLSRLAPLAAARGQPAIEAQILSLVGLAQAMQGKSDQAHRTLDRAAELLPPGDLLAASRVVLERGRIYHQANDPSRAKPHFQQAYDLAVRGQHDAQTVNAAHMIAIVSKCPAEQVNWNRIALELANSSSDPRAQDWRGPIYNNLARSLIEAGEYEEALHAYVACQAIAEQRGEQLIVRGAIWGRALALRQLGQLETALKLQLDLLQQYRAVEERGEMPGPLLAIGRGLVHAELAELYWRLASEVPEATVRLRVQAQLALQDLRGNDWMERLEPDRMRRLEQWAEPLVD
jgi:tetratricopeptide (TPR) repeat protein